MRIRRAPKVSDQIVRQLMRDIDSGKLPDGHRMPSRTTGRPRVKSLPASHYSVNAAFVQLRDLGYLEARKGRYGGTFVVGPERRKQLAAAP